MTFPAWRECGISVSLTLFLATQYSTFGQRMDEGLFDETEWRQLDNSIDHGLSWLATQQQNNGSFATLDQGQPAVTSLCVLAFVSQGNLPSEGPYGKLLDNAIDYVISCQKPNGLVTLVGLAGDTIVRNVDQGAPSSAIAYNHAISSLMLSEVYGMRGASQADKLQSAVENALQASLAMQRWEPQREIDRGGWRYINPYEGIDADLSLTGWELMFLRSAKNAGFDVAEQPIEQAIGYVRRCFDKKYGTFVYKLAAGDTRSRGMAGAGVLALAHSGMHNTEESQLAADWILEHNFTRYNALVKFYHKDRYHYGVFNCTQAMYQIGGKHWRLFFPSVAKTLIDHQNKDGSWQSERHRSETKFGRCYSSSLAILALGAPNQLLPIFQR